MEGDDLFKDGHCGREEGREADMNDRHPYSWDCVENGGRVYPIVVMHIL